MNKGSRYFLLIIATTALLCIYSLVKLYERNGTEHIIRTYVNRAVTGTQTDTRTYGFDKRNDMMSISRVIEQRNNISRTMNLKQQKIGQLDCQMANGSGLSSTGGWCAQESKADSGKHATDKILAAYLAEFFQGKSVGSFGDGPGMYKKLLTESGKLKVYDAYDGAPFTETTSEGRVRFLDLTLPQFGLPVYDWIISMEIAEHIPKESESIYIDNIVRHARYGIVLSWSRPEQGGFHHVNNRDISYVIQLLDGLGFVMDNEASEKMKKSAQLPWLRKNLNVYSRRKVQPLEQMYIES